MWTDNCTVAAGALETSSKTIHEYIIIALQIRYASNVKNIMMTSSNGNIFRVTGPLCGEFTGPGEFPAQRPMTGSFDVFFDLCLNTQLS